jgi:hypothetical protein
MPLVVVQDAAVTHHEPATCDGDDLTERRHPILKRHDGFFFFSSRLSR